MYQALYRSWRPQTFSEICDQDAVVRTLRRQVETGHIAHAYLFCGTRGTGKTTAAKVLSRAINCLHPQNGDPCGECEVCKTLLEETCMDVQEIDAASNNSVDEVRDLRDKIKYPPVITRYKVYIIDEVHMLSTGAFNALLKTLEEPPSHAVFILATTEPNKLPATILSRCQRYDFHRISMNAIIGRLETVLKGIGRSAEPEALTEIARAAEGAMRDALSLLDVCLSFTEGTVDAKLARGVLGTTGRDFMFEFTDALIAFDAAAALKKIDEAMRRGSDPRIFALDTAAHLRGILLAGLVGTEVEELMEITPEDAGRFVEQAQRANEAQLTRAMERFIRVESESKYVTQPRTAVELAAVRSCHPEQEDAPNTDERLARMEKMLENGVVAAPKAKREAKPEKKASENPAASSAAVPAVREEEPPQEYLDAIERVKNENPSFARLLDKFRFAGVSGDTVTMSYGRAEIMVVSIVNRPDKKRILEQAFTDSFGVDMNVVFKDASQLGVKPLSSAGKSAVEMAYEVFGREKTEFVD